MLVLTIASILPWGFEGAGLLSVQLFVVYATFTLFDLSSLASLAEVGNDSKLPCSALIILGRLAVMSSVTLGMTIAPLVSVEGAVLPAVESLSVLLLVAVFSHFTFFRHNLKSEAPSAERDPMGEAVRAIAAERGLTERQEEVLLLVAKGYNARRIEQELFISSNTVKSHLYRLYGKLELHTQQEVIAFVEEQVRLVEEKTATRSLFGKR